MRKSKTSGNSFFDSVDVQFYCFIKFCSLEFFQQGECFCKFVFFIDIDKCCNFFITCRFLLFRRGFFIVLFIFFRFLFNCWSFCLSSFCFYLFCFFFVVCCLTCFCFLTCFFSYGTSFSLFQVFFFYFFISKCFDSNFSHNGFYPLLALISFIIAPMLVLASCGTSEIVPPDSLVTAYVSFLNGSSLKLALSAALLTLRPVPLSLVVIIICFLVSISPIVPILIGNSILLPNILFYCNSHTAGCSSNNTCSHFNIISVKIFQLICRNFSCLIHCQCRNFIPSWFLASFIFAKCFFDHFSNWWFLSDKRKCSIFINSYHDRDNIAFEISSFVIVCLDELHDIESMRPKSSS